MGDWLFLVSKSHLSGAGQPIERVRADVVRATVQMLSDLVDEVLFVHKVTPLAFSAAASVCVAREQCVLTLPSEQPIASAVSATSMSSQ